MDRNEAIKVVKSHYPANKQMLNEALEFLIPELTESEDEKIRKAIVEFFESQDDNTTYSFIPKKDILAWLEKQGKLKSSKWTEGDVVRHGGVLALVTNGRKAMKSNCEQITIQYPDEWVKAETKERKYFFDELEKQGKQEPTLRERYENISTSEWLKRTYDGMSCGMGEEQSQVKESSTLQHEGTHEDVSCKEKGNSLTREQKPQRFISAEAKEALYDTWSEEDERNWQGVIDEIQANKNSAPCYDLGTYDRYLNWLESIKQRLGVRNETLDR